MYLCLTIAAHALREAFLQPAVLAAVAAGPVDLAVVLPGAGVRHSGQLASSEESLKFQDDFIINSLLNSNVSLSQVLFKPIVSEDVCPYIYTYISTHIYIRAVKRLKYLIVINRINVIVNSN